MGYISNKGFCYTKLMMGQSYTIYTTDFQQELVLRPLLCKLIYDEVGAENIGFTDDITQSEVTVANEASDYPEMVNFGFTLYLANQKTKAVLITSLQ